METLWLAHSPQDGDEVVYYSVPMLIIFTKDKMRFNQLIVGFVALIVSLNTVHAQTKVSVYGTMDVGVRYSDGLGISTTSSPSASSGTTKALVSSVDHSSRFGLTGTEDLGGAYRVFFTLESNLYLDTGSTNSNTGTDKNTAAATTNKLFDRQAFMGLQTPIGKMLFGRQQSVIRDIINDIDAIDGRFTSFNPNLQFTALSSTSLVTSPSTYYGTGDPGSGSMARQDNAIKYITQVGPVTGTLLYSFGGTAGSTKSGSSTQAGLTYSNEALLLSAAYEYLNNNNATLKLTAYTLGGRYKLNNWKFTANYGSNKADNAPMIQIKTDIYSTGLTYTINPQIDLTLGYYNVSRTWTSDIKPEATINRLIGFAEYKFSKNTTAYLELDHNKWGGDATQFQVKATNKSTTTGFTIGLNHKIK